LWRHVELDSLFHRVDCERRQLYADHVQRLSVCAFGVSDMDESFALRFPRLRELVLNIDDFDWDVTEDLRMETAAGPRRDYVMSLCGAIRALARGTQHAPLTRLSLSVPGGAPHGVMRSVAAFAMLHVLVVDCSDATLRRADILALQALTKLCELRIRSKRNEITDDIASAPDFQGQHLARLLRRLTRLRRFEFGPEADWDGDANLLRRVATAAPALEELALSGRHDIQALSPGEATPAFPCLEKFVIEGIDIVMPPGVDDDEVDCIQYLE
jgi:hypothetical protein